MWPAVPRIKSAVMLPHQFIQGQGLFAGQQALFCFRNELCLGKLVKKFVSA